MLKVPVSSRDHIRGSRHASATLVEYGDFQCPFCRAADRQLRDLQRALGADLILVFRHFPLTQSHPFALLGAMAAEAAGLQDRFWDMHDILYEQQDRMDPGGVEAMAEYLELDMDAFRAGLVDRRLRSVIHEDFMSGVRSGVNGTPSFYLNGYKYEGSLDPVAFREMLREVAPARDRGRDADQPPAP